MTELLKRWADLQPEWCRFAVGHNDLVFVGPTNGVLGETVTLFRLTELHRQAYALILAAVIEAIEAREGIWDYRLAWHMAPTGEHFGVVKVTREDGWEKSWSCYAGSPAAALLGAYVAALEAEAGQ